MQLKRIFTRRSKLILIVIDLLLVASSFLIIAWAKPATFRLVLPRYINPFIIYLGIWIFISLVFGKYNLSKFKRTTDLTVSLTIVTFIILSTITMLLFALKLSAYSRALVFGATTLSFLLEIIVFRTFFKWSFENKRETKSNDKKELDVSELLIVHEPVPIINKKELILKIPKGSSSREALITREAGQEVYQYLSEHLKIDDKAVSLTATTTPFNIENLNGNNLLGIINLKKVNEMRYINKLFEAVNSKLMDAGMFIGCVETSTQRYKRIGDNYSIFIRQIVIGIDFILNRVMPKLSLFKKLYFYITGGIKRTVSKAEVLGRLVSCGFEIIEYKEINNLTYFVVIKTGEPAYNPNPSWGPFLKVPKIGKNGETIYVYKFRTMYPFSEYLEDYIPKLGFSFQMGKAIDDFRITTWGKFMRKYWLDELPQLINVLKGDMKLVGIKPLNKDAFNEYPEDVKKMRLKHKPGLIPPYVALMAQGHEQSIEAERTYLKELENKPFSTDLKYLKMALMNIVTKKIKSTS